MITTSGARTGLPLPFPRFDEASRAVLEFLHEKLGFKLWMITRIEGNDWIVLSSESHGYGIQAGDVFAWSDSFCSRMVQGLGPNFAPDSDAVSAYAAAPIGRQVPIRSYVGVPLTRFDGSLFGTLCAIDPEPQAASLEGEMALVHLVGRLLATVLDEELRAQEQARRLERIEAEADRDALTGACNRRGWERMLAAEEERCRRYGHPAGVVIVDLDGLKETNDRGGHAAGDRLLRTAAAALRTTCRDSDVIARLGGDEFAILAVEAGGEATERLAGRLASALAATGVRASVGWACRRPAQSIGAAVEEADARMYQAKHSPGRQGS